MTFNYREMLPEEMDASSRVWIYQSSRLFTISEALHIEEMLNEFELTLTVLVVNALLVCETKVSVEGKALNRLVV